MGFAVEGLTKRFGERCAVDQLSFEMKEPGVFGLLGTNGAGKTTSIRMVLGMIGRDAGKALWNGREVSRGTVRFGYMPEERGIYPKAKVLEQLVYFGELRGMGRRGATRAAEGWLERLELTEYRNMAAEKLSKGNQQKVQLISAVINDPELLFLDEPFSGLDPVNAESFKRVIADFIREGKYLIMSSHQMAMVEEYCTDLVILHRGQTVLKGNLQKIKRSYGHTQLSVRARGDVESVARSQGLQLIARTPGALEYRINGDGQAHGLLKALVDEGVYPERFEIRMPSLNEIFLQKVGEVQ